MNKRVQPKQKPAPVKFEPSSHFESLIKLREEKPVVFDAQSEATKISVRFYEAAKQNAAKKESAIVQ